MPAGRGRRLSEGLGLMGMFDTVRCQRRLPDGLDASKEWLQTKDFDCELETYTITEDGRLLNDDGEPMNFHGWLNFYTMTEKRVWHEYWAKFTDGALQDILTAEQRGAGS